MSVPIRILHIEDNEDDAVLIRREFERNGYELLAYLCVENEETLHNALKEQEWDLLLCDYKLPGFNGMEALKIFKGHGIDIPFLLISGTIGEETAVAAMKAGANDYIMKENLIRLAPAVERELRDAEARRQQRIAQTEAEAQRQFALQVMNTMGEGLTVTDAEGKFTYVNPAYAQMLGRTSDEIVGRRVLDFTLPADHPVLEQAFELRHQGKRSIYEIRLMKIDGTLVPVIITGVPTMQDGKLIRTIAVVANLTERKQNERLILTQRDLGLALGSISDLEHGLRLSLEAAIEVSGMDCGGIYLLDKTSGSLNLAVHRGLSPEFISISLHYNADSPNTQLVLVGKPIYSDFSSLNLPEDEVNKREGYRAIAILPIEHEGQVIGCLNVASHTCDSVPPFAHTSLESIVTQIGNAIVRLRAEEQVLRQLNRLGALRTIDQAIAGIFDLHLLLSHALEQVINQLQVDSAAVLLLNPHTQILEYSAGRGFRTHEIEKSRLHIGEEYAGKAILNRQPVIIHNLKENINNFVRSSLFASEYFACYYGVPLITKGAVRGVLEIFTRSHHERDREWMDYLELLAGQIAIAVDNAQMYIDMQRSKDELFEAYNATIEGWSRALDLRDKETEGHTLRVTEKTESLARALKLSDIELMYIRYGALLHDIGKMGIPDSILLKPGKLTDAEHEIMHRHPLYAYDMLSPIRYLLPALDIPYCHHEKWDGTGYPRGLKGKQIPLAARIFAIVDTFDALITDRPYHKAWSYKKAIRYIKEQAGLHFDPEIVKVFLEGNYS